MTVMSQVAHSASGRPGAEPAPVAPTPATGGLSVPDDRPEVPSGTAVESPLGSEDPVAVRLSLLRARDQQFDEESTPPSGTMPIAFPVVPPAPRQEPAPDRQPAPRRQEPTQRHPAWAYPTSDEPGSVGPGTFEPSTVEPPTVEPSDQEWISRLEARARELERENVALRAHRDQVVGEYLAVRASASWRVGWLATTPLRLIRRFARGLAGQLR